MILTICAVMIHFDRLLPKFDKRILLWKKPFAVSRKSDFDLTCNSRLVVFAQRANSELQKRTALWRYCIRASRQGRNVGGNIQNDFIIF
jgi:hypothetical protein